MSAEERQTVHVDEPIEIGVSVFSKHCIPVIKVAAEQAHATPKQLGQLYAGFITGCFGAMVADLGEDLARSYFEQIAEMIDSGRVTPVKGKLQ